MITALITIIGGILAASSLIVARKPNAKELIDKLAPYQGWIGAVMFFWGVWDLFGVVRHTSLISVAPLFWGLWVAAAVTELVVGFLLGFGLITKWALGSSPTAQARGQAIRARLAPLQGTFGLVAIALGILYLVLLLTR
jgi:hypothetical protein